jgi:hypothetical protein
MKSRRLSSELTRLVSAAVVSEEFCHLLLTNPALALAGGYNGTLFQLGVDERNLVLSTRGASLADFVRQLTTCQENLHARVQNGHGLKGHLNGNGAWNHQVSSQIPCPGAVEPAYQS